MRRIAYFRNRLHSKGFDSHRRFQGLDGWISDLFGKSQAWYDRVGRIQKDLAVLLAEINGFGKDIWDTILRAVAQATNEGRFIDAPERFIGFDYATEDIIAQAKKMITTEHHLPSDEEISTAESRIWLYRKMVDFAKRMAPEALAIVEAERARVEEGLARFRLLSPAEVGEKVFLETVEERAKVMGVAGFGMGFVAVAIAMAIALAGARR